MGLQCILCVCVLSDIWVVSGQEARKLIAMIKVVAPEMAARVIDRAMQAHGANGLSNDIPLAQLYAWARVLRIAGAPATP